MSDVQSGFGSYLLAVAELPISDASDAGCKRLITIFSTYEEHVRGCRHLTDSVQLHPRHVTIDN